MGHHLAGCVRWVVSLLIRTLTCNLTLMCLINLNPLSLQLRALTHELGGDTVQSTAGPEGDE